MELFQKKGRAPLKSKNFFIVRIPGEIKITSDIAARLTKYSFVSNGCKMGHFLIKIFQFVKYKNAICIIIEFKFAKSLQNYISRRL